LNSIVWQMIVRNYFLIFLKTRENKIKFVEK
jgi:hypothetical protein